ncbi:restriction endonuclease subunit S [Lactobacillus taiwanensis]|uniref:restriction endonuclease subunit S n=1 Tax=Lactobacillus taiwanensis TaxID=508451 RepID=UPI00214BF0E8|nr:restriction endonuclease subunit S [Lactobacillus taiwanensis]MCR1903112.1 restriction endonuclease subunit S [Lactobacillus taiwanensis]
MVKWLKLKECCEILDSKRIPITAAKRKKGPYPYYGANGVQDYIDDYIFDDELVLLAEDGGNFGSREKPIAYRISGKCWVNNHAHVLKPKKGLNVDYLCYSLAFYNVDKLINGATRKKLTQGAVKDMEIPVVSLATQHKIVSQIKKVQSIKKLRQQQLNKLNKLIKARFVEMFGDLENSKKYDYQKISDLTNVVSGGTPKRDNESYWKNGTIPWIKTTELRNNKIKTVAEYITEEGLEGSSAKLVPVHSVLIAMYGQGKTRGMTGYLNIEASTNQACACILPSSKINSEYLWQYLIMSYHNLRNMAKGGNQPNLNSKIIKNFKVLVPPLSQQNEFANFVQQVDKSKVAVQKSLDETQKLFDSLMQEYFG